MNPWSTLGIEPTSDQSSIRRAYASLLKKYHPEDHPQRFAEIRLAYESAIKLADSEVDSNIESSESPAEFESFFGPSFNHFYTYIKDDEDKDDCECSDVNSSRVFKASFKLYYSDPIIKDLQALMDDYPRRIQRHEWVDLISNCAIDQYKFLESEIPRIAKRKKALPKDIWQLLSDEFNILADPSFALMPYIDLDYNLPLPTEKAKEFADSRSESLDLLVCGNYGDFLYEAQYAASILPNDFLINQLVGLAFILNERESEALKHLSAALEIEPKDEKTRILRAHAFESLDMKKEAASDYQILATSISSRPEAFSGLARINGALWTITHLGRVKCNSKSDLETAAFFVRTLGFRQYLKHGENLDYMNFALSRLWDALKKFFALLLIVSMIISTSGIFVLAIAVFLAANFIKKNAERKL
ncbi:MAG: DnaJ domain-containing protein [Clostridiales bacterium]|jgi:hypothetical protein|nr:DnaJ domain-containing protein [Clostridiales bacterium]